MFEVNFGPFHTEHTFWRKQRYFIVDNCYDPYTRNKNLNYIRDNHIKYLSVQDYDLSFLYECPEVEFVICSPESNHLEALYSLKNLKGLSLATDDLTFDFTKLSDTVQFLRTTYEKKNRSWLNSSSLTEVSLFDYRTPDLKWLCELKNKECLSFFEIRYSLGKMKSIQGIANLKNLDLLSLDCCSQLIEVDDLYKLKKLGVLYLHDNPKVQVNLALLTSLRELYLIDKQTAKFRHLDTLSFIDFMPNLQVFRTDYIIRDGNLKPLLRLQEADILFDRKNYNLKNADLPHRRKQN